ncbi:putative serine/threonine-protein kinase [Actinorhabdospora filicis]|uniref:non-specific serine/threonine protein kinase n=2 Tax=Actinorhabdospora filicis TaxID=1785913 RepID=A0A9W6SMP0_9ACTN|nr:putative serine/threonine-protein kinase [Actinorhabdospora filicis]
MTASQTMPSTRTTRGTRSMRAGTREIDIPWVQPRNPSEVIPDNPVVPEGHRYCHKCDKPVGRTRDDRPGRTEGFCPHCRTPFSFVPSLRPGDVVNDRYEVLGALAHGGLGWIYLARDRHVSDDVSDRWVVLKGLINTTDPEAMAVAIAEKRYLVGIDHAAIVEIFDFTRHADPVTGDPLNYIVMEYAAGQSLRDLRRDHRDAAGKHVPLPLAQVLAYGAEILPAMGYLHEQGLLYCDFKPDNVIHVGQQLKLIDLGAVRRIDDTVSPIYGTPGYHAPEIGERGPSVASDLYTVARSLAVLSFDFHGFTKQFRHTLPARSEVRLFAEHESYHRLLLRATHPDPYNRFATAEDMREQLMGVLRETRAAEEGKPHPSLSTWFTPTRRSFGVELGRVVNSDASGPQGASGVDAAVDFTQVVPALPIPQVDSSDAGAGYLATLTAPTPEGRIAALRAAPVRSPELRLRLILELIEDGRVAEARLELDAYAKDEQDDWRADWYRGMAAMRAGEPTVARTHFDRVYSELPGELSPKLALAAASEWAGDLAGAERFYGLVWNTDHAFVSSAFGLARLLARRGERDAAVAVLDKVPHSSAQHTTAQVAAIRVLLSAPVTQLTVEHLRTAATRLEAVDLDERRAVVAAEVLHTALEWLRAAGRGEPGARLLGWPVDERGLRFGLEHSYRDQARTCADQTRRIALVDRANRIRPRTWT